MPTHSKPTPNGQYLPMYGLSVAKHVNYYYIQLMYDSYNDWQHLQTYDILKSPPSGKILVINSVNHS